MPKLFQITEDDLADLERLVPRLADRLSDKMDNRLRTHVRRIQKILSDVRWDYGPPSHVVTIDAGDPCDDGDPTDAWKNGRPPDDDDGDVPVKA